MCCLGLVVGLESDGRVIVQRPLCDTCEQPDMHVLDWSTFDASWQSVPEAEHVSIQRNEQGLALQGVDLCQRAWMQIKFGQINEDGMMSPCPKEAMTWV